MVTLFKEWHVINLTLSSVTIFNPKMTGDGDGHSGWPKMSYCPVLLSVLQTACLQLSSPSFNHEDFFHRILWMQSSHADIGKGLINPLLGSWQLKLLWVRVDVGTIKTKRWLPAPQIPGASEPGPLLLRWSCHGWKGFDHKFVGSRLTWSQTTTTTSTDKQTNMQTHTETEYNISIRLSHNCMMEYAVSAWVQKLR